ncbi:MAG TPA: OmpA family protein, partial [Xanthomonadaceae bacterium]|nr:OmpA family protein [Xanthomonadaceae bacterium]
YSSFIAKAHRISTTLHFSSSGQSDIFDSRARQDMDRMVALLHGAGGMQQKNVLLVGFANPDPQTPIQAIQLSNQRADSVSSEMTTLGIKVVQARGFGSSKILATPDQADARYRNERVEVWVQQ